MHTENQSFVFGEKISCYNEKTKKNEIVNSWHLKQNLNSTANSLCQLKKNSVKIVYGFAIFLFVVCISVY